MLTKMAWRIVSQPNTLSARVLKSKYFPKHNSLYANLRKRGTWIWDGIKKGFGIVRKYHISKVNTWEDISIWQDMWIASEELLIRPTTYQLQDYTHVSQLINQYNT